jgi:hypothetical protein
MFGHGNGPPLPFGLLFEQQGVIRTNHVDAGSGGTDDPTGRFEHLDEMPGRPPGLGSVARIERRLAAASLVLRIIQPGAQGLQNANHGLPYLREKTIDQTLNEKGDAPTVRRMEDVGIKVHSGCLVTGVQGVGINSSTLSEGSNQGKPFFMNDVEIEERSHRRQLIAEQACLKLFKSQSRRFSFFEKSMKATS